MLLVAIVASRFSGNDKSAWIVIAVLSFVALAFVFSMVTALFRKTKRLARIWMLGTASPLIYAGTVGALSKAGLLDSLQWLGFR